MTTKYAPGGVNAGKEQNTISSNPNQQINQTYTQNHSQSPPNQYQSTQVSNNDGNFKKTRPGQGTPAMSNNSINNTSQVSPNSQQITTTAVVGTGSNYIPTPNSQVNQPTAIGNGSSSSNPNIQVVQSNQQAHQMQQQGSKIS